MSRQWIQHGDRKPEQFQNHVDIIFFFKTRHDILVGGTHVKEEVITSIAYALRQMI